jgi:hypothetical protein
MIFRVVNKTQTTLTIRGQEIASNDFFDVPRRELAQWQDDQDVEALITNEDIAISNGTGEITNTSVALKYLRQELESSFAVDKDATDQSLTGTDWTEVSAERILWDIHEDYLINDNNLLIPWDGIYFFDLQMRLSSLTDVDEVELAVFKRESPSDDYWFIIDKKTVTGLTEVQLKGATSFDFYESEEYCLKIKLYGTNPSATISGDDDFTAWGFDYRRQIT